MIYNSDTDTSFLEFQSRVRDTFLRYAKKWKFVIIDAKQEKAQMLSELVQQLKKSINNGDRKPCETTISSGTDIMEYMVFV